MIATFNHYHLGDNLIHLHWLRAMAKRYPEENFCHFANPEHISQLRPLVYGSLNVGVYPHEGVTLRPRLVLNSWRGHLGHWHHHPEKNHFARYHLAWFRDLAAQMGLESPFEQPADLLFDYPALLDTGTSEAPIDFLIINSAPQSGQWSGFSREGFDELAASLSHRFRVVTTAPVTSPRVACTRDRGLSVTQIGHLSQRARVIIGCVTGPMWPCLNRWANADRIHLLDHEIVDHAPRTLHTSRLSDVPRILRELGCV